MAYLLLPFSEYEYLRGDLILNLIFATPAKMLLSDIKCFNINSDKKDKMSYSGFTLTLLRNKMCGWITLKTFSAILNQERLNKIV